MNYQDSNQFESVFIDSFQRFNVRFPESETKFMEIREATATSSAGFSKIMESFNGDHHQTDDNGPMSKQIWSKKLRKIVPFERAETPATFSQHHNYPVRPGSTSTNTESTSMSPPSDHDGTVM